MRILIKMAHLVKICNTYLHIGFLWYKGLQTYKWPHKLNKRVLGTHFY
jgi:hypothetical protein